MELVVLSFFLCYFPTSEDEIPRRAQGFARLQLSDAQNISTFLTLLAPSRHQVRAVLAPVDSSLCSDLVFSTLTFANRKHTFVLTNTGMKVQYTECVCSRPTLCQVWRAMNCFIRFR